MSTAWRATARTFVATLAVIFPLAAAVPATGAVVINEVDSDPTDFVELYNSDAVAVDISGYVIKDSNDGNSFTVPGGTLLVAGGTYLADNLGFGLGSGDSARLYRTADPATLLDTYTWAAHAITSYGRCPDGTGALSFTNGPTPGAANNCPPAATAWPGSPTISIADGAANAFGGNLSGLAYQPSGSAAPGVLWAVRNNASTLFRLVLSGGSWQSDSSNGWGAGKTLVYTDGGGVPDAEGVTLAGGDANGVFVSTERNDNGGNTSRPAVLRYDVSSPGSTLTATKDWNLTPDLPGLDDNAGLEAITWVPDSLLTAKGFVDQSTAAPYDPLLYPDHGSGLFFVGVEQDGRIIAYVLNQTAGTYKRIASIESGFPAVMGLEYEAESTHLWAACDDSCDGRTATLDIAQSGADDGRFVVTNTFARPAGMVVNLNNEGFAIAPQAECVAGLKPVFYADDGNSDQHALRSGALTCTVPPQPSPTATPTPTPTPLPSTPTPVPPAPTPTPMVDRSAPSLKLALKFTASGKHAVRRSGKFGVVLTLGERADLTITATARKNARAKARRILQTTRKGVAAGKRTVTLSLTRKVRAKLRKGETVTLTVVARDAAGNATTSRANAKVK